MSSTTLFWLGMTLLCILLQGYYSMMEMACVSFNRLRLQYCLAQGNSRLQWLHNLLQTPSRLFGTTLLCINIALQIGSECSRLFYLSLGLSPSLAPLTQVILVVIFAELTPMFAARRYTEHVVSLGLPLLYATSRLLTPLVWIVTAIANGVNYLTTRSRSSASNFLMERDELMRIIEGHMEQDAPARDRDELMNVVQNIFAFKVKTAEQIMEPLNSVQLIPSNCTVSYMRSLLSQSQKHFLPVYHRERSNIIGIATPHNYLHANDTTQLRNHLTPPWFIPHNTPITTILEQFRINNRSVAIVLDAAGTASGVLTLEDILEEIFGDTFHHSLLGTSSPETVIERTLSGSMSLNEFNKKFQAAITSEESETLSELMFETLGHPPEEGEEIHVDRFKFIAQEASLREVKKITVKSLV